MALPISGEDGRRDGEWQPRALQREEDLVFSIQAGAIRVIAVDAQNISATVCVYQIGGIVGSAGERGQSLRSQCWPRAGKRVEIHG
jgi:hypothetical protein